MMRGSEEFGWGWNGFEAQVGRQEQRHEYRATRRSAGKDLGNSYWFNFECIEQDEVEKKMAAKPVQLVADTSYRRRSNQLNSAMLICGCIGRSRG